MTSKIFKKTQGKPCSCPEGKEYEGCEHRKKSKQFYIEEPRRLSIPLEIRPYGHQKIINANIQILKKPRRWIVCHKPKPTTTQPTVKKRKLCQWYKRKRTLKQLKAENKKEKKNELKERRELERHEREQQLIEHFRLQQELEKKYQSSDTRSYGKEEATIKVKKPKKFNANKTSYAKPRAASRSVSVKRRNRYDELSKSFVNCFYRFCCQVYCYLTCFLIIGFVVIIIL